MLAVNSKGVHNLPQANHMESLKKYTINTLVFIWKLFWNAIAFIFRAFAFCCKIVAYTFFAITAIFLLRRRR